MRFRVAGVSKPLLSVAELVDADHRVIFDKIDGCDISRAVNKVTGMTLPFVRRGKIFELDWHVGEVLGQLCPLEAETPDEKIEVAHEALAEVPVVKMRRSPVAPTEQEIADHEATH